MSDKPENGAETRPQLSPFVLIRGAGEMASAIAVRLFHANIGRICMLDLENPLCVRRHVSFSPALLDGAASVEGVASQKARNKQEMRAIWQENRIAVMLLADWDQSNDYQPEIVVDAILAKKNLGTTLADADLVVALGPGFEAGVDCHRIVETNRGHDLGRIIDTGCAAPNTGIPGAIAGETKRRILRAPCDGVFHSKVKIGGFLRTGDIAGHVGDQPVVVDIDGMIRGLIQTETRVSTGLKLGDIDPRGELSFCHTISDKARAISGSVLECVMGHTNRTIA